MNIWGLHKEIPGLSPLPPVSDPEIKNGAPIPCYQMTGAINTKDGWNAAAEKSNTRAFRHHFGREPENYDEVTKWVNGLV